MASQVEKTVMESVPCGTEGKQKDEEMTSLFLVLCFMLEIWQMNLQVLQKKSFMLQCKFQWYRNTITLMFWMVSWCLNLWCFGKTNNRKDTFGGQRVFDQVHPHKQTIILESIVNTFSKSTMCMRVFTFGFKNRG